MDVWVFGVHEVLEVGGVLVFVVIWINRGGLECERPVGGLGDIHCARQVHAHKGHVNACQRPCCWLVADTDQAAITGARSGSLPSPHTSHHR